MDFTSKLSLYDTLTMLVTGFLILFLVLPFDDCPFLFDEWYIIALFVVACYLVGMFYHKLLEWLLKHICRCKFCLRPFLRYSSFRPNNMALIRKAFASIYGQNYCHKAIQNKDYIAAYYQLMQKGCLGNIPVLEAQEAFLRDLPLIILSYLVMYLLGNANMVNLFGDLSVLIFILTGIIVLFGVLWLHHYTQKKIYYLVWEGNKYLNEIYKKKTLDAFARESNVGMNQWDTMMADEQNRQQRNVYVHVGGADSKLKNISISIDGKGNVEKDNP